MHRSNTKPGFRLGCVFNVGGKSCLCVFWGVDAEANPRLVTPLGEKSLRWKVSSGHGFGAKKAWGFQQKWRLKLKHFTRSILYGMIMVMVLMMMMMMMMMMMYAKRMEIYRENAKRDGYHLDWTPGLNTYRKNPSVWPHCLGNKANVQPAGVCQLL